MAARRLILVLAVLLGISIAAAAIAPDRQGSLLGESTEESTESTTTTEEPEGDSEPEGGEIVAARVTADPSAPETVRARPGDQLELSVDAMKPLEVEIEAFGVLEVAEPDAPAAFSILLREPGEVAITDAETGDIVGRIISEPERAEKERAEPRPQPGGNASRAAAEPV